MIALGVIAAVWLLGRRLEAARGGHPRRRRPIALWAVLAGMIGARLYHVATDWDRFRTTSARSVRSGRAVSASPAGWSPGSSSALWRGQAAGHPGSAVATAARPAMPLAQAIGRWGNWFNQELFGKPTDLPWALEIDDDKVRRRLRARHDLPPDVPLRVAVEPRPVRRADLDRPALPAAAGRLLAVYAWATASAASGSKACTSTRPGGRRAAPQPVDVAGDRRRSAGYLSSTGCAPQRAPGRGARARRRRGRRRGSRGCRGCRRGARRGARPGAAPGDELDAESDGRTVLNGRWPFTSNCLHSGWAGLSALFQDGDGLDPVPRVVFVPMSISGSRTPGTSRACAAPAAITSPPSDVPV